MPKINSSKVGYASPEGSATWEYLSAISCFSLIFSFGCLFGWTSPNLVLLMGEDSPIPCTDSDVSVMLTAFGVGVGLAPLPIVVMADRFGRKNMLLAVSVPLIVNWGMIAVAKDVTVLSIARFIAGISCGLGLFTAPIYLGEIASPKLRGALGMLIETTLNVGMLFMFLVMPHISLNTSGLVCSSISTVSMITLWFIPESPYFLAARGKIDAAEVALERLRGKNDVADELDLIKRTISYESKQGEQGATKFNAFKQLVTVGGNRKAIFIIVLFITVLHFGSYAFVMLYGNILFDAMKTSLPSTTCVIIMASLQLVSNILTTFQVDRFGRRPLILASGLVSGGCVMVIAVYFYLIEYANVDVTSYSIIPVLAMFVNITALSMGLIPMQMVIRSEILATEVKALAGCVLGVTAGVMTVLTDGLYLKFTITWGFGHSVPFLVAAVTAWTATGLILKMLPETKGKTFLEIQRDLNA